MRISLFINEYNTQLIPWHVALRHRPTHVYIMRRAYRSNASRIAGGQPQPATVTAPGDELINIKMDRMPKNQF